MSNSVCVVAAQKGIQQTAASSSSLVLLFALVFLLFATGGLFCCGVLCRLLQCSHHVLLEGLLLEDQPVLVPNEVGGLGVESVPFHAVVEEAEDVTVVWVVGEFEGPAVLHKLLELDGLVQTQFVNGDLLLLSLDVVIFFVFGPAGETLPGKGSSQEVEQYVTNCL